MLIRLLVYVLMTGMWISVASDDCYDAIAHRVVRDFLCSARVSLPIHLKNFQLLKSYFEDHINEKANEQLPPAKLNPWKIIREKCPRETFRSKCGIWDKSVIAREMRKVVNRKTRERGVFIQRSRLLNSVLWTIAHNGDFDMDELTNALLTINHDLTRYWLRNRENFSLETRGILKAKEDE